MDHCTTKGCSNNITDSNDIQTTTASNDEDVYENMNEIVTMTTEGSEITTVEVTELETNHNNQYGDKRIWKDGRYC